MYTKIRDGIRELRRDERGQDMIEYALMASFVAITVAAFIPYTVIPTLSSIYSRLLFVMSRLTTHG